jgi:hypothetical protein
MDLIMLATLRCFRTKPLLACLPKRSTSNGRQGSSREAQIRADGKSNLYALGRVYSCDCPPAKRAIIKDPSMIAP